MSDADELIARAKSGDQRALEKLFAAARPRLRALVKSGLGPRLREQTEVEDILQSTFVRACEFVADFHGQSEASFRSWLFSIARNLICEEARHVNRFAEIHDVHAFAGVICDKPSSATVLRRKERFVRVHEAIDRLRPEHAEVLQLAFLDQVPLKEVAVRMGRSHGGVRNLLGEAMKRLRGAFGNTDSWKVVAPSSQFLRALGRKRRKVR